MYVGADVVSKEVLVSTVEMGAEVCDGEVVKGARWCHVGKCRSVFQCKGSKCRSYCCFSNIKLRIVHWCWGEEWGITHRSSGGAVVVSGVFCISTVVVGGVLSIRKVVMSVI